MAEPGRASSEAASAGGNSDGAPHEPTEHAPRVRLLPYLVVAVVTFFVAWFIFATVTGLPVGLGPSPAPPSSGTGPTGVILTIDNPFDTANNNTADQYAPANFTVPADTELKFTLINYDTGQNLIPSAADAQVNGTGGNCIYLNVTNTSLGPCVHSVNPGFIAHTFSFESGPYTGFNVPIPSANETPEGGIGASVTFFAWFNVTGTFTWHCLALCDPWSMITNGFMTGTMTVAAP